MAVPTRRITDLRSAVARLTGDSGKRCSHVTIYRIRVVTKDNREYGLRLSLGNNVKDPPKGQVTRLVRKLCLADHDIDVETVLAEWGPNELTAYIRDNLTQEDLDRYPGG